MCVYIPIKLKQPTMQLATLFLYARHLTDVLWYGSVRPYVRPYVRPSVRT